MIIRNYCIQYYSYMKKILVGVFPRDRDVLYYYHFVKYFFQREEKSLKKHKRVPNCKKCITFY